MGAGFNDSVYAIEIHSGGTYAAGAFTASGATALNHVARWTGSARYMYQGVSWITAQPSSVVTFCRWKVNFNSGLPPGYQGVVEFQCYKDGELLEDGWNLEGSLVEREWPNNGSTATFSIEWPTDADERQYQFVFTNSCGAIAASTATLTLQDECPPCPWDIAPGCYGDGLVGVPDLLYAINSSGAIDHRADVNRDGIVGVPDLLAIIGHWGACP